MATSKSSHFRNDQFSGFVFPSPHSTWYHFLTHFKHFIINSCAGSTLNSCLSHTQRAAATRRRRWKMIPPIPSWRFPRHARSLAILHTISPSIHPLVSVAQWWISYISFARCPSILLTMQYCDCNCNSFLIQYTSVLGLDVQTHTHAHSVQLGVLDVFVE